VLRFFCKISNIILGLFLLYSLLFTGIASAESRDEVAINNLYPLKEILSDRILGKSNAPVTIIEYASMTCPHCSEFHTGPFQVLKKEYIRTGKVKFIYRDFPLDRLAVAAAMMARCAPKDRYYAILNIIYSTQQDWAKEADPTLALSRIGLLAGISDAKYKACVGNKEIYEGIIKIRTDGTKQYEIQSTPTVIVNGNTVKGEVTIKHLRNVIDAELAKLITNDKLPLDKNKSITKAPTPGNFMERVKKWLKIQ
jgi:protein-disulfide isomerase